MQIREMLFGHNIIDFCKEKINLGRFLGLWQEGSAFWSIMMFSQIILKVFLDILSVF